MLSIVAFITNDTIGKTTSKKRKKGIIKKVSELTILCGIYTYAIIFSLFYSKTKVWLDLDGAKKVIEWCHAFVIDESKNVYTYNYCSHVNCR